MAMNQCTVTAGWLFTFLSFSPSLSPVERVRSASPEINKCPQEASHGRMITTLLRGRPQLQQPPTGRGPSEARISPSTTQATKWLFHDLL
jgi:hypothetical protein